jgi:hypothetical protein
MLRAGRFGLLLLAVSAWPILGARAPLNPTVKILTAPAAPVPAECEEGLAPPPAPRINIAEVPEPRSIASAKAPPSASLREQLQDVQSAAARRDREAFAAALSRAKATLQSYPSGAEKKAASDVVRVYDDVDRLWTYEFDSPSGAFFDSSNELLAMLNGYPGYSKAIADQTMVVRGTKLYPARESRDFLAREASARLARFAGGKMPVHDADFVEDTSKALPPIVTKVKRSEVVHVPMHVTAIPVPRVKKPKVEPPPIVATTTTATTAPPPPPPPVTTTTSPPPPVTTATTAAPATATTAEPLPQKPASTFHNVVLPIILIVLGIGVLVVLFRASS